MSEQDAARQERRLDEILNSGIDPATKAQQIIRLGFDAEMADEIVERQQLGNKMPMYYETLAPADDLLYDDTTEDEVER